MNRVASQSTIAAMSKALLRIVLVAAIVALAVVLNPSAEKHLARIQQALAERSPIAQALGLGTLAAFVSNYHPLGVASYTTVGDKTISVGAFGVVFVLQPSSDR
jgi:hypothetical protein